MSKFVVYSFLSLNINKRGSKVVKDIDFCIINVTI